MRAHGEDPLTLHNDCRISFANFLFNNKVNREVIGADIDLWLKSIRPKTELHELEIKTAQGIIDLAKEKGAEGEFGIGFDEEGNVTLWIDGKDRFECKSLNQLKSAIVMHDDLSWVNQ